MTGDLKFSVTTLGCKANLSESDLIARELLKKGFRMVDLDDSPDINIINTCTVTLQSDRKTRQLIRKIKSGSTGKLVITGCFTELNSKVLGELGVDLVVRNKNKKDIPSSVARLVGIQRTNKKIFSPERQPKSKIMHSRPLVKVQDGCQQNCSYCIVPRVRGPYHSGNAGGIIKEINYFQEKGFEEIVLTGIHIGKYGVDLGRTGTEKTGDPQTLAQLLNKILSKTGIKRIRLSSIEISEFDGGLIDIISKNRGRFAEHLHISLQSGSNRILMSMNRPYLKEYFLKKVKKIKNNLADFTLTTDIIVGFPGENENDFKQTIDLVREVSFSKLHVFKFSGRPGTPAVTMPDQVAEEIKSERSSILREIGDELREDFLYQNIGKTIEIVCEESANNDRLLCGVSGNYNKVYVRAGKEGNAAAALKGKIIKVFTGPRFKKGLSGIMKV